MRVSVPFVFALAVLACPPLEAQSVAVKPTTQQAQTLLETRPDLVSQLRQRLVSSGLTADQVRARLVAEGYPANLLDAYLSNATTADSVPSDQVFAAVQALGITNATDVQAMRGQQAPPAAISAAESQTKIGGDDDIFGLSLFRSSTSQFQPNLSGPVDAKYKLGPGDELVLILTGEVQASYTLDVTREGFVVIPQVGRVPVANLTLGELTDLLFDRLARVYSGVKRGPDARTHFTVSVARLRTNQVFVVGDVEHPGSYQISSAGTALTALYAAAGPTANGSMRNIEIRRGGKLVDVLDVYDYLLHGDASHDVRLETGDIVFVPVHDRQVRVEGEVVRPAIYELKGTESLPDLLRDAGGFRAAAARRRVQIDRILPPTQRSQPGIDRVTMDVSSADFATGFGPAVPLEPGDVVRVFAVANRVRDRVSVSGDVWNPGPVGLVPGMTVASAIKQAGGPKADVYLGQILISRLQADSTRIQLRASFADSTGTVVGDFPLREDDIIQVFSQTEFRPELYVAITGAVGHAGQYPYRRGMTLRDLVLEGGGLKEGAYLEHAEIARLPESRAGGVTATTVQVPLDSTYLFDRKAGETYLSAPGLPAPASGAPEVHLQPYDNVLILRQPNFEMQRTVTVTGEVLFPGTYSLKTKSDRLSDVIRRAGGFTKEAYPSALVFNRRLGETGRIAIDVSTALRDTLSAQNLLLANGDDISVPKYNPTVRITGAVNAPTTVAYVQGADLAYYVQSAGGFSKSADEGRTYVTQPNGQRQTVHDHRFWFDYTPIPLAGSEVVVPEEDPNDKINYVQMAGSIAQALAGVVGMIALVKHW